MPDQRDARSSLGRAFDDVAEEYDRHRPTYPDALIDRACEGVAAGAAVLEIGCGTGQLTRSLLARGLRVTAVEPGEQLMARARAQLNGAGDVRFVNARLEDASLPRAHYSAACSASAIHWIDPDVSWRKAVADALVDGGTLALVSYFGLDDPRCADDQQALRTAVRTIAPELDGLPAYRNLADIPAGVAARRENVSEVWAWLGSYELARGYAADLFDEAQVLAVPKQLEHTADEINALLGTMSFWARLSTQQRDALVAENQALHERLGRPIRSTVVACLVVARRRSRT